MLPETAQVEAQATRSELVRWSTIYSEAELYKAALRVYTKPLFVWRKALSSSIDGKTLYDFARRGLENLERLHRALARQEFEFRPGLALHYNFKGKGRTVYIYPWEERIVDLLLYRLLSRRFHGVFSPQAFAYRLHGLGVDRCQREIARTLRESGRPLYVCKRDISEYFPSMDHAILEEQLARYVPRDDFLWRLLVSRIQFRYLEDGEPQVASRGVAFGTPTACFFANLYLTETDRRLTSFPDLHYFRYADDFLFFSPDRATCCAAKEEFARCLTALCLRSKPGHEQDLLFASKRTADPEFAWCNKFRHLGLEFRASGVTGLSRDKFRKLCNLFRFAFRRHRVKLKRIKDPEKRARLAIEAARKAMERGVRSVAILDYYLKHVQDEEQLSRIDRWLAEEVLSIAFGGHRRGNFRKMSFRRLRTLGLPSIVHRRQLILHRRLEAPFFVWKCYQETKSSRGTAARPRADNSATAAFSPRPEAAAEKIL